MSVLLLVFVSDVFHMNLFLFKNALGEITMVNLVLSIMLCHFICSYFAESIEVSYPIIYLMQTSFLFKMPWAK